MYLCKSHCPSLLPAQVQECTQEMCFLSCQDGMHIRGPELRRECQDGSRHLGSHVCIVCTQQGILASVTWQRSRGQLKVLLCPSHSHRGTHLYSSTYALGPAQAMHLAISSTSCRCCTVHVPHTEDFLSAAACFNVETYAPGWSTGTTCIVTSPRTVEVRWD